ncbi:MAG: HAD family hydrolase [Methanomassiliicoccaceae archaeon]|nr:HAD family hydrolase [Methanomassiliicoccaceae archaeon]
MFNDRKFLVVGFDMDSTLLDTDVNYRKLSLAIYNEMIREGVPDGIVNMDETSKFNLDDGLSYLKRNNRSDDIPGILERIQIIMKNVELENVLSARPYGGAEAMLAYLRGRGYKIGVLTRGSREYAEKALTVSGVADMIDALVCRDDHDESESKPSPLAMYHLARAFGVRPNEILYLGDNKIDYFCARNSGAGFIGVLTRYTEQDWISVDDRINMIGTVADLTDIL